MNKWRVIKHNIIRIGCCRNGVGVKNQIDMLIFRTAKCVAGITFSIYRRAKSDIWLAIPSAFYACGNGESVKNNADAIIFHTAICFRAKANSLYGR